MVADIRDQNDKSRFKYVGAFSTDDTNAKPFCILDTATDKRHQFRSSTDAWQFVEEMNAKEDAVEQLARRLSSTESSDWDAMSDYDKAYFVSLARGALHLRGP